MKVDNYIRNRKNNRMNINWDFFSEIPIREIAESLNIELTNKNFFCCPAHNDNNPSASINEKDNYWHCFSCGCSGNGLSLTAYTLGFLKPGGKPDYKESAIYLDKHGFDGGITYLAEKKTDEPDFPDIPPDFYKTIGLKQNPFSKVNIKDENELTQFQLSPVDASRMVIFKIREYIAAQEKMKTELTDRFPELSKDGIDYIYGVIDSNIGKVKEYSEEFRKFGQYYYDKEKEKQKEEEEEYGNR